MHAVFVVDYPIHYAVSTGLFAIRVGVLCAVYNVTGYVVAVLLMVTL